MAEVSNKDEIIARLNILINLTLKQNKEIPATKKNFSDIVQMLYNFGMRDAKEIATIIEAPNPISVANVLTKLKGTKGSRKSKRKVLGERR